MGEKDYGKQKNSFVAHMENFKLKVYQMHGWVKVSVNFQNAIFHTFVMIAVKIIIKITLFWLSIFMFFEI